MTPTGQHMPVIAGRETEMADENVDNLDGIVIDDVGSPEPKPTEQVPIDSLLEEPKDTPADPDETPEEHEERKKRTGSARLKEKLERTQQRLAELEAHFQRQQQVQAPPSVDTGFGAPPDFNDPKYQDVSVEVYYQDLARYEANKQIQQFRMEQEAAWANQQAQQAQAKFQERCTAVASTIPDWDEAMDNFNYWGNQLSQVAPVTAQFAGPLIRDSEVGPELAVYYGRHPEEIKQFAGMAPAHVVAAIARKEADILANKRTKQPPVSKAPDPISTVRPGSGSGRSSGGGIKFY